MATKKLEKYLVAEFIRGSVVSDNNGLYDPEFNPDDLEDILSIVARAHECDATEGIPDDKLRLIILACKKELYHRLAVKSAPLYTVNTENINLNKQQRFMHYYYLIQAVDLEYRDLLNRGIGSEIVTGEILIDGKYTSRRNYEHSKAPTVTLTLDQAYLTKLEISWTQFDTSGNNKFGGYFIYISNIPIIDIYNTDNIISTKATLVASIYDIFSTRYRLENLEPDTEYYIAVISQDRNSRVGHSELLVRTLAR